MRDQDIECFYDIYVTLTDETIDIITDPDKQRAIARAQGIDALRDMLAVDPSVLYKIHRIPPGMLYLKKQLAQCTPYILSQPVVRMVFDVLDKAGSTTIPYEHFPKLPFWAEFDNMAIGDNETQFAAILAVEDQDRPGVAHISLLTPDMQRAKTLEINLESGTWAYEQLGRCKTEACGLARTTEEDEPYSVYSDIEHVGCICYQGGKAWAGVVSIINGVLNHRKEPLAEQLVIREVEVPHQHPRTRAEKAANSEARRANRRNMIEVSLSAPVEVSQRPVTGHKGTPQARMEIEEQISVEGYYKVLIPGEGKPWKSLQIIPVQPYKRAGKPGMIRKRYRVVE